MRIWSQQTVTLPPANEGEPSRQIQVRPLWAIETDAIDEAYPRPVPPMVKDPNAGSLSPKIPNENDPEHIKALRQWLKWLKRAQVAIATQPKGKWDAAKVKALAESVAETYTTDEIEVLWVRLRELSTGEMLRHALSIIVTGNDEAEATEEPMKVPESYGLTEEGLMLRAAERFGQNPAEWPKTLSPEDRAKVLANEIVRRREENEKMDAIRSALGILGA